MNDATNYAKSQADVFKQSLQYLVDAQNQQKLLDEQALNQRYTNLVNQINQKRLPIEQQFGQDARGAYVNKMLAQQNVGDVLNRMNLSNSGFGLGERIGVDNAYGQNLNALTLNRNSQLSGINNEITNVEGQRLTDLLGLQSQYAGRAGELNQYITKSVDEKYNQEYNNYMKNKEYEDMLKQQAWDNNYKNRALTINSGGGGGGGPVWVDGGITEPTIDKPPVNNPSTPQYKDTDVLVTAPKSTVNGPTKQNATDMLHPLAQLEQNLKNSITSASAKVLKRVSTPGIKLSRNAQTAIKMLPNNITATELRKILDKDVKYGRYTKKEADAIFNSFR